MNNLTDQEQALKVEMEKSEHLQFAPLSYYAKLINVTTQRAHQLLIQLRAKHREPKLPTIK